MAWAAIDDLPARERLLLAREILNTLKDDPDLSRQARRHVINALVQAHKGSLA